ncbi:hypothetical protein [Horticoccus sp. 23ND18S-11]|uniref:hypothetical protein n=1 Tax=Horticoccus sp. 23ND18S-11 TaxID=3391832 RepID=UPI0039C94721
MTPAAVDVALLARAAAVWLVIGGGEVVQGILRVKFLNRRVGDHRARQIGVGVSCLYIFAVAFVTLPWINPRNTAGAWCVGGLWLGLMLALELTIGRWAFHLPWNRIAADFDLRRGRLLILGMLFLLAAPWLAATWRGLL